MINDPDMAERPGDSQNLHRTDVDPTSPVSAVKYPSLSHLFRAAYAQKRKRLTIAKADLAAIRSQWQVAEQDRNEILDTAVIDRTLVRTKELFLVCISRLDTPDAKRSARDLLSTILRRHPTFGASIFGGVFENLPDSIGEVAALRALMDQNYSAFAWPDGVLPLRKKEIAVCRQNAVHCLLLWFRETRGLPFERIQHHLNACLWSDAARRAPGELQRIRLLMSSKDAFVPGIVSQMFEKQLQILKQQIQSLQESEIQNASRLAAIRDEKNGLEAILLSARAQVAAVEDQLRQAERLHSEDKAHMRADFERLRGGILRRLREDVGLLDDGLQALSRTPPKVHVMQDFADRVVTALRKEIERLQGET